MRHDAPRLSAVAPDFGFSRLKQSVALLRLLAILARDRRPRPSLDGRRELLSLSGGIIDAVGSGGLWFPEWSRVGHHNAARELKRRNRPIPGRTGRESGKCKFLHMLNTSRTPPTEVAYLLSLPFRPMTKRTPCHNSTSHPSTSCFSQLNSKTGNRIKYKKVDAATGEEVESADIVKGYQFEKGQYVQVTPEEWFSDQLSRTSGASSLASRTSTPSNARRTYHGVLPLRPSVPPVPGAARLCLLRLSDRS